MVRSSLYLLSTFYTNKKKKEPIKFQIIFLFPCEIVERRHSLVEHRNFRLGSDSVGSYSTDLAFLDFAAISFILVLSKISSRKNRFV